MEDTKVVDAEKGAVEVKSSESGKDIPNPYLSELSPRVQQFLRQRVALAIQTQTQSKR